MRAIELGRLIVCLVGTCLAVGGIAMAQPAVDWEPVIADRLLDPEDSDWMSYRGTYDVTGFSPLDQINRSNVADLRLVWAYSMRDVTGWVPTPVVANGLMYVSEGSGRVTAFDVVSGEVAWLQQRSYPEDIERSQAFMRHRGVSVYGDTIYCGTADAALVALDARTGEQRWEVSTGDYTTGLGLWVFARSRTVQGRRRKAWYNSCRNRHCPTCAWRGSPSRFAAAIRRGKKSSLSFGRRSRSSTSWSRIDRPWSRHEESW